MKKNILGYSSSRNGDGEVKAIIKDVLITAGGPHGGIDYSSPSRLSLKCPSQSTKHTSIHSSPVQHMLPVYQSLSS